VKANRTFHSHLIFPALLITGGGIFCQPLITLGGLILSNDSYSHIVLIPLASIYFIWSDRKAIYSETRRDPLPGAAFGLAGLALYALAYLLRDQFGSPAFRNQDVPNDYLTLCMAGAVCWVIGSFIFAYGVEGFKRARFALLFLFFAVPIPMFVLNGVVQALQVASAEAANIVFRMLPVTYHRQGMVFQFPNLAIEVAEECSGIRSSMALFVLSVITGRLFLKKGVHRAILAFSIFPVTVFKNALRISTITLLANYVDMKFLTNHWIHSSGGIPFFAAAMAMFIPIVWLLRRWETKVKADMQTEGCKGACKFPSVT
jgi:exosortase